MLNDMTKTACQFERKKRKTEPTNLSGPSAELQKIKDPLQTSSALDEPG